MCWNTFWRLLTQKVETVRLLTGVSFLLIYTHLVFFARELTEEQINIAPNLVVDCRSALEFCGI